MCDWSRSKALLMYFEGKRKKGENNSLLFMWNEHESMLSKTTTLTLCHHQVMQRLKVQAKLGHIFTAQRSSAGHTRSFPLRFKNICRYFFFTQTHMQTT